MRYVFTKPKTTYFSRIQGVFSSRRGYLDYHYNMVSFATCLYRNY